MTDADDFAPPPGSDPPPPLPPAATGEPGAKGFVGALFDYSFSRSATPKIVRVLYVLITIGIVVGYLAAVSSAYRVGSGFGAVMLLIIGPVVALIYLALARVALELCLSVSRMSEDIHAIRRSGGRL